MSVKNKLKGYAKYKAARLIQSAAWKLIKKLILAFFPSISVFFLFMFLLLSICYILVAKEGAVSQGLITFTSFSPDVEAYRDDVVNLCEENGMLEYTNVILAIMQVETQGQTLDPMNAGDKLHNELYPKRRGSIDDPLYSIEVGILELKDLIELTDASLEKPDRMLIVYQSYHYNRDYIDFANSNGGYTTENAKEYLKNSPLPYYLRSGFAINVASYVYIQSGYINPFIYPVDMEGAEITCSFGEETSYGFISKGTYIKTNGETDVVAITDGDVLGATKSSITIQHGNYKITYRYLTVDDAYLPDDDDEDDDEPEKTYVDQGDFLGTTRNRNSYEFLLQVSYDGKYIDPMTLMNITLNGAYDADSGNNNMRDAIVDYAKLWMSTPYVWGGTNLHTGVDCSGFMQQIYKNFGYSLPRVSRDQANYSGAVWSTTDVYPNVLMKGDLIFYTDSDGVVNHVTMYIGDGLIIGAQSRKTGIKITQYNYRTPVKAIRVIP